LSSFSKRRDTARSSLPDQKLDIAGGREEFRENRKQLRCCNWIQLPIKPIIGKTGGEGGKKASQEPEYSSHPLSFVLRVCGVLEKTFSQKKE
jgi:hypothetical protein